MTSGHSFRSIRPLGLAAVLLTGGSALAAEAVPSGDAERGASLYERRCGACHSIERNRVGPRHRELIGRVAGSLSDYAYSKALRDSTLVWDARSLDRWLTNPQALIPGQKMGFRLGNAVERADIIAYLKSESGMRE